MCVSLVRSRKQSMMSRYRAQAKRNRLQQYHSSMKDQRGSMKPRAEYELKSNVLARLRACALQPCSSPRQPGDSTRLAAGAWAVLSASFRRARLLCEADSIRDHSLSKARSSLQTIRTILESCLGLKRSSSSATRRAKPDQLPLWRHPFWLPLTPNHQ
jgi:hypothetical protein